jgi:hypothetical protein
MAFSLSGLYVTEIIAALSNTIALDLTSTGNHVALYSNSLTPNFSSDTAYSTTNELATTGGYTQGGIAVASPTVTESPTGTLMYDLADSAWTSASFTARGAILFANALSPKALICAVTFGSDFTAAAGTFTIQYAAGGLFTLDLTP